ncbi:MAG TPA: hypothetical protein VFB90_02325 [Dehalococcoidia bacterium]|nr:hypothetical protein [Dehalococcoidia bacterium]
MIDLNANQLTFTITVGVCPVCLGDVEVMRGETIARCRNRCSAPRKPAAN